MSDISIHRMKRLIDVRIRQQEKAGTEMAKARGVCDRAKQAKDDAQATVDQEMNDLAQTLQKPVTVDQLDLTIKCIGGAMGTLVEKEKRAESADTELQKKNLELMRAHTKVKQMEELHDMIRRQRTQAAHVREQRETDDLAAVRKARQQ